MKIVASETSVKNILESLRHKRKLIHDELSRKKKRQNLSQSNSDEAVLIFSMKRTDDKAKDVFKEHNSVSSNLLTKIREGFMSTIFIIKKELGSGTKITIIITKKELEAIEKTTERNKR